ncbi:SLC13 family permease [Lysinibacter cavernae]|uniref:Na+/H+ antiporter NhaD/arsenite permease-like protein n=1 Tax=Lysinibacter cavernae TaxID=1640652 RepID=A0A7X5TUT1_9MICO|nr:Na+/H+ antiporter NhaD/arsenite permease-like protein [Lysinibacter cavernae]
MILEFGERVVPIFVFLIGISVVVNVGAAAGVFDRLARASLRLSRGRNWVVWVIIVLLSVLSTAFLSLDTTAVLLTPIAMAFARAARLDPLPYALTVVWLANTASLFLPVSNLTNLLAASGGVIEGTSSFIPLAIGPALASVGVTVLIAALVFRRQLSGTHSPPELEHRAGHGHPSANRAAFALSCGALLLLVVLLVTDIPYWMSSTLVAATLLLGLRATRSPLTLGLGLVPWRILGIAAVLMVLTLVVQLIGGHLLDGIRLTDSAGDAVGLAAAGLALSNGVNNLPAYLLLEPLATSPLLLIALLIGTNVGPLITPWASLANLLWHDQLRRGGEQLSWMRFALLGLLVAPLSVAAATWALIALSPS